MSVRESLLFHSRAVLRECCKTTWRACVLVFLAAFALRVGLIFATRSYLLPELGSELVEIAMSLAKHGSFADAYRVGHGPTAHTSPLYPILLSLVYRLFGVGTAGSMAQEIFSSFLASVQYAIVPYAAVLCGFSLRTGLLGGALGALLPINRWAQTKGSFEYALSALLFIIVSVAVIRTWQQRDFSLRRGLVLGSLWGLTLSSAPQFVTLMVVVLVCPYLILPATRRRYWIFLAAHIGAVIVCLAPWTIRNLVVLHAPIWSRSNLGFELNLANNDEASPLWDENMDRGVFLRMHPSCNPRELRRMEEIGEPAYSKEKAAVASRWIAEHPARFAGLTVQRVFYFWFPPMHRRAQGIALGLITLLGFLGFSRCMRRRDPTTRYFLLVWLIYPLAAYLFIQSGRMRYPIEWISYLFAGALLASLGRSVAARARASRPV